MILLLFLSVLLGLFSGVMALFFHALIAFFHNAFFHFQLSFAYDVDNHITSNLIGPAIIFMPPLISILVTWIIRNFAPEAKGHGVPEVMYAVRHKSGHIRVALVLAKVVASALTIGSGGSVGREGPIVQACSAAGSFFGRLSRLSIEYRVLFVSAGASAGLAATFNAPVGGIAFAVELMLMRVNAFSLIIVSISTVTATIIWQLVEGGGPAFSLLPEALTTPLNPFHSYYILPLFMLLGIIIGVTSACFIQLLHWFEKVFENGISNDYLRHISGMFLLGLIMYGFFYYSGKYYVIGVGYSTIYDIFHGLLSNVPFLFLLFFAKLLCTCLTIGSGGSGGIFSPSLFLGATLGSACAGVINYFIPGLHLEPIFFAIAGMAAMVSGTTGASITAIILVMEMTRSYNMVLPIILASVIAYGVRLILLKESIYTLKLARRGITIEQGLKAIYLE